MAPISTDRSVLQTRLLAVMDEKHHPGWPAFTKPGLTRAQLTVHFGQELAVYVRDFPILLARLLGQGPPTEVRRALAENLYEEQTGGLSGGVAHPELFLRMIDGLGIARRSIEEASLLPASRAYRAFLDEVSAASPWVIGAAVLTIFVEGSVHERAELAGSRVVPDVEEAIANHPMVKHYGCPPSAMGLVRAHRAVESGHRKDAWRMVLENSDGHDEEIVAAVVRAASLWRAYRDAVCEAAGIT
ncbi:MAG: iron-containing redox enzyme family protein [Polyangiales bacterium]